VAPYRLAVMLTQPRCVVGNQVAVPRRFKSKFVATAAKAAPQTAPVEPKIEAPIVAPASDADDKLTAAERAKRMQVLQQGIGKADEAADDAVSQDASANEASANDATASDAATNDSEKGS